MGIYHYYIWHYEKNIYTIIIFGTMKKNIYIIIIFDTMKKNTYHYYIWHYEKKYIYHYYIWHYEKKLDLSSSISYYTRILDIFFHTQTVAALRGEMGASLVKSRVMETSLQYIRSTMNGEFKDMKELMLDTIKTEKGRWYKLVNSYREELRMTWEEVFEISKNDLKKRIKEYDTHLWEMDLAEKTTLKYYAMGKTEIGYNFCYRNNINSTFLARARVNSLRLEEAVGRGNKYHNKTCKLCGKEDEDIVHFIVKCKALETKRRYDLLDRSIENPEERMVKLLFKQQDFQGAGRMIKELWFKRKDILKNKERLELVRQQEAVPNIKSWSDPGPKRQRAPLRERPRGCSTTRG